MKQQLVAYFLLVLIFGSISVMAQSSEEGRITEHSVVSLIALSGLITIAYFVRKSRMNNE